MKYRFEHDQEIGVCIVRVSGEHKRPDDSKTLQIFARDFREEHRCSRYLFDMREATITGSTLDVFKTGIAPATLGFGRGDFKVALVYASGTDDHKFIEDVVVNRGYMLRVFLDIDEALSWLTKAESAI